jgi:hypothetical protein
MAAARPQTTEGPGGVGGGGDNGSQETGGEGSPPAFRQAVAALVGARPRPEVRLRELPAPQRLAPFSYAMEATVVPDARRGQEEDEESEELADGRFVLLHDPAGQDSWQGTFRVVTLTRAELEPEMAGDPLLPEVTWSWLTGALEARGAAYSEPSGTVTRSGSYFFGGLADRPQRTELEIRASWTPLADAGPAAKAAAGDSAMDLAAHLAAWSELLCQCAGLPPDSGDGGAVVPLPQRRGPRSP